MNDNNRYTAGVIAGMMFFLIFPPISLLLGLVAGFAHLRRDGTSSEYYSGHAAAGQRRVEHMREVEVGQ